MSALTIRHEGRWLRFVEDARGWEYAQRTNTLTGVVVIAVTQKREVIFVEQFRIPLNRVVLELPAGLSGDGGTPEDELASAQRELLEETGYGGGDWRFLFAGPTSPGLTDEQVHFFLARDVGKQAAGGGVPGEAITVHVLPLDQAADWLDRRAAEGVLLDPKVYLALHFAAQSA
jgi:ADP-ribose pyrophosphatase